MMPLRLSLGRWRIARLRRRRQGVQQRAASPVLLDIVYKHYRMPASPPSRSWWTGEPIIAKQMRLSDIEVAKWIYRAEARWRNSVPQHWPAEETSRI